MTQARAYEGPTPPTVAGYRVEELVGVGGTGEVWRARDVLTGRLVALKRLRHDGPPVERDRLRREAAVLAGLSSPHIVRLVTVVTSAGGLVLVLDFQGGGSLASLLRTRPVLAPGEVVTIAAPLADALAEVHALGMVHGDLSPANVLFSTDGRPMLSDLGVARLVNGSTGGGLTAAFADPAVLDGAPFTPASDVYALAAVCFTALTGTPLTGTALTGTPLTGKARSGGGAGTARPALSVLAPAVPVAMAEAIEAALADDAADRPDAATFAARLLEAMPAAPVRLAGATVPVESPPTAAVRRPSAPPAAAPPAPSRSERLAGAVGRLRVTPRRLVAFAAVPVAVGGAIWGGVAWARSTTAGAPAWTVAAPAGTTSPLAASQGPLGRPGTPDPGHDQAAGVGPSRAPAPSGSPRPGATRASTADRPSPAPTAAGPLRPGPAVDPPQVEGRPAQVATVRSATAPATSAGEPGSAAVGRPTTRGAGAAAAANASTDLGVASLTQVLRRLDSTRDNAFEAGSVALLNRVYVAGSAPLAADQRLLATMMSAGEHSAGLGLQLHRVRLVASHRHRADLLVTDTLAPYDLVSTAGARVHMTGRGQVTWRITLVETSSGWRIGAVTAAPAA